MPYSISRLDRPPCALIQMEGAVDAFDLIEAYASLLAQTWWRPATAQIWDYTALTHVSACVDGWKGLQAFPREHEAFVGDSRVAVISDHPDIEAFADQLAYRYRSTPRELRTVRSLQEATAWLDAAPSSN